MRQRLAMVWGLWSLLVLQTVVLSAAAIGVWQGGIRNQVEDLRSERFRFSLLHVKSVLESGLRLGNATADLAGAERLIREVRDRQPDILSIDVYDAQGELLFSTDAGGLGLGLPAAWAPACLRADAAGPWIDQDADGGVQCTALVNAFGQGAGSVVLRHRRSARAAPGMAWPGDGPVLAAVLAAVVLAAAMAGIALVRPMAASAQQLRAQLGPVVPPEAPQAESETPQSMEGFGPASAALRALADHDRWLTQANHEADHLDRQEPA